MASPGSAGPAPPIEAEALERRGRALLAEGRAAEATAPLESAIRRDPGRGRCWHDLAVCYALAGRTAPLIALVETSERLFKSPLAFFHDVAIDLMARRAYDAVLRVHDGVPESRPYHAIALYYAGCVALAHRRWREAFDRFARFRAVVVPNRARYPVVEDENFNVIFRQGTLIEPPEMVARIAAAGDDAIPPFEPAVEILGDIRPPPGRRVAVVACNGVYFRRFVPALARSLFRRHPAIPLHAHVVAAGADDVALIDALRRELPGLALNASREPAPGFGGAVYHACSRFLAAPRLLDLYRCPLLVLDADLEVVDGLESLLDGTAACDFACFDTGRTEPASLYSAALMHVADSAPARRFLDIVRKFVLLKLPQPPVLTWMLDQAALFSVIRHLERAGGFSFCPLDQVSGRDLGAFVRPQGSMDEKRALMNLPRS
jgi:tetratricopeptide (TPR) repeat protein